MIFNSFLLFAIGDGIFIYGMHEFQENGAFGSWFYTYRGVRYPLPDRLRPWINQYLADFSKCCSSDKPAVDGNGQKPTFFTLLRAVFGYQAKPTRLEIICYCCYWGAVILILGYKASKGTLWGKHPAPSPAVEPKSVEDIDEERGAALAAEAGAADDVAATPAAPAEEEQKDELFSSVVARLLLRLTAGCTRSEAPPSEAEGDAAPVVIAEEPSATEQQAAAEAAK